MMADHASWHQCLAGAITTAHGSVTQDTLVHVLSPTVCRENPTVPDKFVKYSFFLSTAGTLHGRYRTMRRIHEELCRDEGGVPGFTAQLQFPPKVWQTKNSPETINERCVLLREYWERVFGLGPAVLTHERFVDKMKELGMRG